MSLPPPPPGLDLSATQVPRIMGVNIATYILAVIAVTLRFVSRRLTRANLWWDDWLMVSALVMAALMGLTSIVWMVDHGLGRHIWAAPPDAFVVWAKGLFISEISYTLIICSIKFSVLCFYWRIFKQSKIRIPIYVVGGIVSCWGVAVILVTVLQCVPVSGFWERFDPSTTHPITCGVDVNKFFNGNSIPNIITDAAIIALPVPFIWQLQLPKAQKIALINIFVLGIFIVGVSIARFTFIINLDLTSPDITWNFVNTQIWTGVESHIGIVCACLPSLRPILSLILTGSADRSQARSGGDSHGYGRSGQSSRVGRMWSGKPKNNDTISTIDEIDNKHLFTRMSDSENKRAQSVQVSSSSGSETHEMKNMGSDGAINVTTDIYVEH